MVSMVQYLPTTSNPRRCGQLQVASCARKMDASPERSLEPLGQPKGPSQLSCKTKDPWHSHKKNLPKSICGDSICRPPENKQGKVQ